MSFSQLKKDILRKENPSILLSFKEWASIYTSMDAYATERAKPLVEALNESIKAMEWMWENMQLVLGKEHLQSDAFNIPANALSIAKEALEPYNSGPPATTDQDHPF